MHVRSSNKLRALKRVELQPCMQAGTRLTTPRPRRQLRSKQGCPEKRQIAQPARPTHAAQTGAVGALPVVPPESFDPLRKRRLMHAAQHLPDTTQHEPAGVPSPAAVPGQSARDPWLGNRKQQHEQRTTMAQQDTANLSMPHQVAQLMPTCAYPLLWHNHARLVACCKNQHMPNSVRFGTCRKS